MRAMLDYEPTKSHDYQVGSLVKLDRSLWPFPNVDIGSEGVVMQHQSDGTLTVAFATNLRMGGNTYVHLLPQAVDPNAVSRAWPF